MDGKPQPERVHRLEEIFASSEGNPVAHAMQLAEESAQFNLGRVYRTVNLPTFVLSFLRPANRKRLTFESAGSEDVDGTPTWIVSYREQKDSSFIATPGGKGLKASGRFWAEPASGRVLRTELVVGPDRATPWRAHILVNYKPMPENGVWLPAEMREVYDNPRKARAGRITGEATYANYRRLEVRRERRGRRERVNTEERRNGGNGGGGPWSGKISTPLGIASDLQPGSPSASHRPSAAGH